MADKYPKSKLKRKKSTVVEHQADIYQRGSLPKISIPFSSPHVAVDAKTDSCKTNRTVSPTLTWWTRNDLNSSEKLWAQTIETVLPLLGSELWDPLPEPSTATPRRQGEPQPPCPADDVVPPFPEPSRPPGSPLQSAPPPPRVTSPAQPIEPPPGTAGPPGSPPQGGGGGAQVPAARRSTVRPLPTTEGPRPPATQQELGAGRGPGAGEKTQRSGDLAERSIRPYPLWGGPAPKEAPPGRPSSADTPRVQTMRRPEEAQPPGAEGEGGREGGGPKETELGGGGGGGRLQCCPMCTQVFPSRFSQMDCDSHLAQCLSEMNVDMAW